MKQLTMELGERSYNIYVGRDILKNASQYFNLNRKCFIVTDSGVPREYAETVKAQCKDGTIVTIPQGEASKNLNVFADLLREMLKNDFSRKDCVVAVGGGVVGDLAGYVASSYMRGIDFYNIPTTTLSQVDSSIGGKVAIDFEGVKNAVGAFYQPKGVIVDVNTLDTQTHDQYVNGLAEAIKTGLIYDAELFDIFEAGKGIEAIDEVIYRSLLCKKDVVEKDEKELSLRKILNFGHTLGHAVESSVDGKLLHGQCVAIGMLPMLKDELKNRVQKVLELYDLPVKTDFDLENATRVIEHDKKNVNGTVSVIKVYEIGKAEIEKENIEVLKKMLKEMR